MIQNQMKRIAFIIALVLCIFQSNAQGNQVAVLYHGNEFQPFYSQDGFKQALDKAENGDIITLSPGTFTATDITKAVTIRGAGIGAVDTLTIGTPLTQISGDVKINIPVEESGYTLSIEGVSFPNVIKSESVNSPIFSKCHIFKIYLFEKSWNLTFIHCIVDEVGVWNNSDSFSSGLNCYNCYIGKPVYKINNATYKNCIINIPPSLNNGSGFTHYGPGQSNIEIHNCIYISTNDAQYACINSSSYASNTVWIGKYKDWPFQGQNSNAERMNVILPANTDIFKKGTFYELNEAGLKYKGDDGTQIGLYGSDLPFSVKTSYPQIKKFKITPESTDDGMLKIEFEIDADN